MGITNLQSGGGDMDKEVIHTNMVNGIKCDEYKTNLGALDLRTFLKFALVVGAFLSIQTPFIGLPNFTILFVRWGLLCD